MAPPSLVDQFFAHKNSKVWGCRYTAFVPVERLECSSVTSQTTATVCTLYFINNLCCRYKAASIDRSARGMTSLSSSASIAKVWIWFYHCLFRREKQSHKLLSLYFAHGMEHCDLIGHYQILVMSQTRYTDVPGPSWFKREGLGASE